MQTTSRKIEIIEALRAIAAIFVVISHIAYELLQMLSERGSSFNDKLFPGDFGVDLFFVISGFVMVYTCWDKFGHGYEVINFIRKRVIRIVPLYWVLTTLMICVVIFLPSGVNSATDDVRQWISSYLFIPYARETDGLIRPVLGLGWSLQFEMFFYLLFAFCLFLNRKAGLVLVMMLLIIPPLIGQSLDQTITFVRFATHPIILEFGAGIIIGTAFMSGYRLPNKLGIGCVCLGLVLLIMAPAYSEMIDRSRHIHYGIPAFIIMGGFVLTRFGTTLSVGRVMLIGGEISYSIYLTHPFVIGVFALVFGRLDLPNTLSRLELIFTFSAVVLFTSLVVGLLTHFYLDQKITRRIGKIWQPIKSRKFA